MSGWFRAAWGTQNIEATTRMARASNVFKLGSTPEACRLVSNRVLFWISTKKRITRGSVIISLNVFAPVPFFAPGTKKASYMGLWTFSFTPLTLAIVTSFQIIIWHLWVTV